MNHFEKQTVVESRQRYRFKGDHEKASNVGLGLSPLAQAHIRSARTLMEEMGWPDVEPDLGFVELTMDAALVVRTEKTHVAYTRDADGQARLYINGKEAAAAQIGGALSAWDAQMRLALGDELVGGRAWRGVYHGVALYNRALEASQIADHSATGVPKHLDGLQVLYRFDEGEGTVIRDVSSLKPALDLYIHNPGAVAWREDGLEAHWFDPFTGSYRKATPRPDGCFQPPSREIWLLMLRP